MIDKQEMLEGSLMKLIRLMNDFMRLYPHYDKEANGRIERELEELEDDCSWMLDAMWRLNKED